jgi:hypothetical protein
MASFRVALSFEPARERGVDHGESAAAAQLVSA